MWKWFTHHDHDSDIHEVVLVDEPVGVAIVEVLGEWLVNTRLNYVRAWPYDVGRRLLFWADNKYEVIASIPLTDEVLKSIEAWEGLEDETSSSNGD